MIKYNNSNINDWNFGDDNIAKVYYGVQGSQPRLPSGYTEVEYIENQSHACIDVGFVPNQDTRIVITMQATDSKMHARLIGAGLWNGNNGLQFDYEDYYNGQLHISWGAQTGWTTYDYYGDYNVHTYDWNKNVFTIDDTFTASTTYTPFICDDNLGLFVYIYNGIPCGDVQSFQDAYDRSFFVGKLFSCKIYDDGTLIRDFVPCTRDSDSIAGVYDIVNNQFYTSALSGNAFIAGSAVTPSSMSGRLVYQKITNGSTPPTPPIDYANEYLTFVAQTDGVTIGLSNASTNIFQYSLDSGSTWNNLVNKQSTPSINNGDKIMFKASGLNVDGEKGIGRLHPSASASVEGNVMSLIYGDDFSGQTAIPNNFQFRRLFSGATNLTSAENFVIPATSLRKQCYSGMFQACTSLTKTPKAIGSSAMTWNGGDYVMSDMFHGCTSLTTVPSGLLPALNLGNQCYWYMFEDCSSLTETPHLLATEAATQCYQGMFKNCSSLNNVTCLLRNPSTYNEWLVGVAANGTFYKNSNASWSSGSNGIPTNWTVVDYTT